VNYFMQRERAKRAAPSSAPALLEASSAVLGAGIADDV
jgi:hypothetical protein